MNGESFKTGMGALVQAFPDKKMDLNFMWKFLNDLNDQMFLSSIEHIIRNEKDLYPGTNIIALIRDKALPKSNSEIRSNHSAYVEYKVNDFPFEIPSEEEQAEVSRLISDTVKNMN